jgi:hypothetical protein
MWRLLLISILQLCITPAFAVTKCLVDGKTIYQSGPCLSGVERAIEANVSNVDSEGLRSEVRRNNAIKQEQLSNQKCNDLMRLSLDVGDGSYMSFSELGAAKRKAKAALELYKSSCGGQTKDTDQKSREVPTGYMTKDAFGNYQNSNDCYQTKDAFGNYQQSPGCSRR